MLTLLIPSVCKSETIVLAADVWPPYNLEPGSAAEGYMVDVAREVFKRHGIKVEYRKMAWTRAIESAGQGTINGIIASTREDAPGFIFPDEPLAISRLAFFTRKEDIWVFNGHSSLLNRRIGVIGAYNYGPWLNKYIETHGRDKNKIQFVSGADAVKMNLYKLLHSRIDVIVENEETINYLARQHGVRNMVRIAGRDKTYSEFCYIAFSPQKKESRKYAKILSDGIVSLRKSGRLSDLQKTYGIKPWTK